MQDSIAIPAGRRVVSPRFAPILGAAVLVVATLGLASCIVMFAWGLDHYTGGLLAGTIEMHTDRMLEAGVPQPVIECVRTGQPVDRADLAVLDADTRDLVQATVNQVEAVRMSTAAAAATGRHNAVMVAMLCVGMALVGLYVLGKTRRLS